MKLLFLVSIGCLLFNLSFKYILKPISHSFSIAVYWGEIILWLALSWSINSKILELLGTFKPSNRNPNSPSQFAVYGRYTMLYHISMVLLSIQLFFCIHPTFSQIQSLVRFFDSSTQLTLQNNEQTLFWSIHLDRSSNCSPFGARFINQYSRVFLPCRMYGPVSCTI